MADLDRIGFLTLGIFDQHDPYAGHESTLQVIELGEQLGYDSAWVRHRHFQYGISSPVAVLAAATQRTSRIELGTAVIPLGWENPVRLAEDLATVDVLSRGRLHPGLSVKEPQLFEHFKESLYPGTWDREDFSYQREVRLLDALRGKQLNSFVGELGQDTWAPDVQPHVPGLVDRVWQGAGGLSTARWAGEQGLNLLLSNIVRAETDDVDFRSVQRSHIDLFRAHHPLGEKARAAYGPVVIPTDGATPEQIAKYRAYVERRTPRTLAPQGPRRLLFARDLIGTSEQIAEALLADVAYQAVDEVVFPLPFTFAHEDYVQILTDVATRLAPALGWKPAGRGHDPVSSRVPA